jgi:hypothetical protein
MTVQMIIEPRPHNVGSSVDNNRHHVDKNGASPVVHRQHPEPEDVSRSSSTGSRVTDASVYRDRALSSPESTVAKTTDENL